MDFIVTVSSGPATVEWYLEFTNLNPNSVEWFREVSEDNNGGGSVAMAKVVRTFQENGGAGLATGTHRIATPLTRPGPLARIQIRCSSGTASAQIVALNGFAANAP
jgi:hypothetical protein